MEEEEPFWSLIAGAERTRLTGASETGTRRDSDFQDRAAQRKPGPGKLGAERVARAGGYSLSLFLFSALILEVFYKEGPARCSVGLR